MQPEDLDWSRGLTVGVALTLLILFCTLVLQLSPTQALPVYGAAFATSTGATKQLGGRRWPVVGIDLLGKSLGLMAGCYAARLTLWGDMTLAPVLMVLGAAVIGNLTLAHKGLWWVSVQCFIFIGIGSFLSQKIPAPPETALSILAATAYMALFIEARDRISLRLRNRQRQPRPPAEEITAIPRGTMLRQAIVAAVSVALCWWVAQALGLKHVYWALLVSVFALRPDYLDTRTMVLRRGIFTILGAALASLGVAVLPQGHLSVYALFILAAMGASILDGHEFRYFIACITAGIILLISLAGSSVDATSLDRVGGTIIGCIVTVIVAWLGSWLPGKRPEAAS